MKKVCFFMATPFSLGGEQRVVSILSNLMENQNYDVTIMCTDIVTPVNYDIYNLDKKIKIKYVKGYNNKYVAKIRQIREKMNGENAQTGKYKNSLLMQKFINCDLITELLLIYAINKENYNYVISLSTTYNTMLARISKKIKSKTIGWQHSFSDAYFDYIGRRHYNQEKYTKYMFKKLDSYVVLTEYDRKYLKEKYNYDAVVINNPKSLCTDKISKLDNKSFVSLGRFVPVKNYEMLIDIFKEFHKKNKEWKLIIVGEGELKEKYLKKIKKEKLEDYILIEPYTNDIEKYYLDSSIYLLPSLYEGFPMVLTEAIEYGLPVISFSIAAAPEMIKENENGFIIKNYDKQDFTNKMLLLANNPKLLKEFGKKSKQISRERPNIIILNKWIELFKKIEK